MKASGVKASGVKASGVKATGVKATGAHDSQEMGGKGGMLMGEREVYKIMPGDTTAGQNATGVVIEWLRRRATVFVRLARKADRTLSKGDDVAVCFPRTKLQANSERKSGVEIPWVQGREDLF